MATQIFVNLPVKNLNRSIEFFRKLGYTFNPQFTDENATCMIISDTIFVMLVVEPLFLNFTKNELCDTRKYTESIICLSTESRDAVDEMVKKPSLPVLQHRLTNRIMAGCTDTGFRTWTDTSGKLPIWILAQCHNKKHGFGRVFYLRC